MEEVERSWGHGVSNDEVDNEYWQSEERILVDNEPVDEFANQKEELHDDD